MFFLCIILLGYTSGIFFKIYGNLDEVIFLYILNSILVAIDIALTLKYRKNLVDRKQIEEFEIKE
jgi:hypothetical protein